MGRRNPQWVDIPFFAEYDPKATWFNQLKPAFGAEKFFFEEKRFNNNNNQLLFE